jgi:multiple sugar transport system substrate-binding protein
VSARMWLSASFGRSQFAPNPDLRSGPVTSLCPDHVHSFVFRKQTSLPYFSPSAAYFLDKRPMQCIVTLSTTPGLLTASMSAGTRGRRIAPDHRECIIYGIESEGVYEVRRWLSLFLSALLVLVCVTGPVGAQKTKIMWTTCCGQTDRMELFNKLANEYMAANPKVEIDHVYPTGSYAQTLLTWIAGGVGPDVMWIGGALWSFVDLLLPLDDLLAKDRNVASIHPTVLRPFRWDGKQIALPYGVNPNALAYNRDLFSTAGVPFPTSTWVLQDIVTLGKRLSKDTDGDGTPDVWAITPFPGFHHTWTQAGDFYSEDLKQVAFVNPASIEATQFAVDLKNGVYGVCAPQSLASLFYDQKVAMYQIGVFFLPSGRLNCRFDWDVVEYPALVQNGVRHDSAWVGFESWMVNKDTKNPEIAKDFVCWLFRPDVMEQIAGLGQVIPSQTRQAKPFLNQPTPPYNLNALVRSMDFAKRYHLDHPAASHITAAYLSGANAIYADMFAGRVPVAAALPEIARQINAYLTEWWAQR